MNKQFKGKKYKELKPNEKRFCLTHKEMQIQMIKCHFHLCFMNVQSFANTQNMEKHSYFLKSNIIMSIEI